MIKIGTLSFLNEIGLSDIQIKIYRYLLNHKFGAINEIKRKLNYSYTQIYQNLLSLEKRKLINSSSESKPKIFFRVNPKIALTELLNKKYENFTKNINKINEEIKISESFKGSCIKNIGFYHYSDISLGIENYYYLIENAEKNIILTSLPPSFLKKLEIALYNAFIRGVKIDLFFSTLDFEAINNYLERLTNILKRLKITIVQTKEKICQYVRFNDSIVNMGNILIDESYLNAVLFLEDEIFHFDGFIGPRFVQQAKKSLEVKTVVKKIEIEYPESIQNVLNIINESKSIKTRDLSTKSKIGGSKLREIILYLVNEGIIEETIIKGDHAGRPRRVYSIVD